LVEAEERRCILVKADVGREADVARIYREAIPALGGLDILVNNAGVEQRGKWEDFALPDWERILRTNLTGAFLMIRVALRGGHLAELRVPGVRRGKRLHRRGPGADRGEGDRGLSAPAQLGEPPAQTHEEEARVLQELGRFLFVVVADELEDPAHHEERYRDAP